MSLINPVTKQIADGIVKYKKPIAIGVALICFIIAGFFIADRFSGYRHESKQKKSAANLANAVENLTNLQQQKAQIEQDEAVAIERINQAQREANEANREAAEKQRIEEQANANYQNSLNNLNAIRNGNYNGVSPDDARAAQCAAYPASCGR